MGRGRAKAKQTRIARDLKYHDVGTDLTQLANELRKSGNPPVANGNAAVEKVSPDPEIDDQYAAYADYGAEDGDDDDEGGKDDGGSHRSHHRPS